MTQKNRTSFMNDPYCKLPDLIKEVKEAFIQKNILFGDHSE